MAAPDLDLKRIEAGREYHRALVDLHFDPNLICWAYDHVQASHVILIVTEFFDYKGPLAISKLLFEAYRRAATPREIDPFIVQLHSPWQDGMSQLIGGAQGWAVRKIDQETHKPVGDPIYMSGATVNGLEVKKEWLISAHGGEAKRRKVYDISGLSRQWQRFSTSVERLAA